jgi:NTE family protein
MTFRELGRNVVRRGRARSDLPRPIVKTAFVLSGGGVLGAVQVGQLQALIESGIVPDLLVGASVGALNAAATASDPTLSGIARLRDVWMGLRGEDLFPGSRMQRAWHFVRKGDHLYPNDGIKALTDMIPGESFEQMVRPLSVVAANMRTGKEHWFETGPLAPALLASTALPSIFPPVLIDGEYYLDGGVVNNVPISRAVEQGARRIYVLTCGTASGEPRTIKRPLDVLVQAFAHSRAARMDFDVERYAGAADIRFLPVPAYGEIRFNDCTHTARLMKIGYEATIEFLSRQNEDAEAAQANA